jgi:hypothetical protein
MMVTLEEFCVYKALQVYRLMREYVCRWSKLNAILSHSQISPAMALLYGFFAGGARILLQREMDVWRFHVMAFLFDVSRI